MNVEEDMYVINMSGSNVNHGQLDRNDTINYWLRFANNPSLEFNSTVEIRK